MKIGVVSDTHSRKVPAQLFKDFKKVDLIIHAGDFCELEDYEQFSRLRDVKAVRGNMDAPAIRKKLPRKQIFELEQVRVGLFHGEGARQTILQTVMGEFQGEKLDVVIFGHSHQPLNEKIKSTLYFNPGSPNDDLTAPYCSYGILEVNGSAVSGKIIKVKN